MARLAWGGNVLSVQPRIRLTRSFDQRSHTYLGYALHLRGTFGGEVRQFSVGIGKAARAHGVVIEIHRVIVVEEHPELVLGATPPETCAPVPSDPQRQARSARLTC